MKAISGWWDTTTSERFAGEPVEGQERFWGFPDDSILHSGVTFQARPDSKRQRTAIQVAAGAHDRALLWQAAREFNAAPHKLSSGDIDRPFARPGWRQETPLLRPPVEVPWYTEYALNATVLCGCSGLVFDLTEFPPQYPPFVFSVIKQTGRTDCFARLNDRVRTATAFAREKAPTTMPVFSELPISSYTQDRL